MTEEQWLNCTDPTAMLAFARTKLSDRKLILFGCACCRRQWHILPDDGCKSAVETAERFVDGVCNSEELRLARMRTEAEHPNLYWPECCGEHAALAAFFAAFGATAAGEFQAKHPLGGETFDTMLAALKDEVAAQIASAISPVQEDDFNGERSEAEFNDEQAAQCELLRDILGSPSRDVIVEPESRTPILFALAQGAYAERHLPDGTLDSVRLNVLADALEDAGCTDPVILRHCRGPGPHVRGCWVLDLILGRHCFILASKT